MSSPINNLKRKDQPTGNSPSGVDNNKKQKNFDVNMPPDNWQARYLHILYEMLKNKMRKRGPIGLCMVCPRCAGASVSHCICVEKAYLKKITYADLLKYVEEKGQSLDTPNDILQYKYLQIAIGNKSVYYFPATNHHENTSPDVTVNCDKCNAKRISCCVGHPKDQIDLCLPCVNNLARMYHMVMMN